MSKDESDKLAMEKLAMEACEIAELALSTMLAGERRELRQRLAGVRLKMQGGKK